MWRTWTKVIAVAGILLLSACTTGAPGGSADHPGPRRPTGESTSQILLIAHRGASAYAPKDTIPAIRQAIKRGADVVEVDIRQTRDHALIALFNKSLAATTNVEQVFPQREPWLAESFTLAEIRRLDAGSWFGPSFAGTKVPTLNEVLATLRGTDVGLIVEAKTPQRYPGIGRRIVQELRSHASLPSRSNGRYVEIESFDWDLMRRLNRMAPQVTIGLAGQPPPGRLKHLASFADAVNPQHTSIEEAYVDRAHDAGLAVKVWSVNDPAHVRGAVEIGVDGIYSHKPDMVKRVLTAKTRSRRP